MTAMLVLTVDRDTAAHIALAIRLYRNALRDSHRAEPPGLSDLETATVIVSKRPERSGTDSGWNASDDGAHAFITRAAAARIAGVSPRTIDRWTSSGQLPSRKLGRVRRIERRALEGLLSAA